MGGPSGRWVRTSQTRSSLLLLRTASRLALALNATSETLALRPVSGGPSRRWARTSHSRISLSRPADATLRPSALKATSATSSV